MSRDFSVGVSDGSDEETLTGDGDGESNGPSKNKMDVCGPYRPSSAATIGVVGGNSVSGENTDGGGKNSTGLRVNGAGSGDSMPVGVCLFLLPKSAITCSSTGSERGAGDGERGLLKAQGPV